MTGDLRAELTARVCPLCGDSEVGREVVSERFAAERLGSYSFASRKPPERMHWRFVECASCGLVYASATPPAEWFLEGYRAAAYDSGDEARYAAQVYDALVGRIAPELPGMAGAVDIGAGDGAFLERLLARGFSDVVGFEPSDAPRSSAPETVRGLIRPEPFDATSVVEGSLVLASCLGTIEHVPEPLALCRDVARSLQPGGALLMTCHNVTSLSATILRERSPIFDLEHFQLFSRETIRRLLVDAGFTRVSIGVLRNTYPLHYWLRLAPLPAIAKRALGGLGPLGSLPVTFAAGNLWAIGFCASDPEPVRGEISV